MKVFFTIIFLFGLQSTQGEVFSSVSDMSRVFQLERDLVGVLLDFAQKTQNKLNKIAGNPIHTYNVVKRLAVDFVSLEKEISFDDWKENSLRVERLRLGGVVPKEKDLHGAAQALIRLQDVYELEISHLVRGRIGDRDTTAKLTAQDCLFIGKHCFNGGILSRSIEWFEEAWYLAGEEQNTTVTQDKVSRNYEVVDRQGDEDDAANFAALCRGEELRTGFSARLSCRLEHRGEPYLFLMPAQLELVHDNPEILMFHNIASRSEIQEIKDLGNPLLTRSQVLGGKQGFNEVSSTRTSKTGWLDDSTNPTVSRLGRRIELLTGLKTNTSNDDAELLQVANYMNGGHYSPHFDYVMKDKAPDHMIYLPYSNQYIGDRLATWMFYLNEVGEGGRTVFPRLKAGVKPEAGAAVFWYNLVGSGDADHRTLHGACPVLYGTKWVANKWIREGAQLFRKPCAANIKQKSVKKI
ncbi:prolyl 4-hydroxylase subunit alpha-2 [Eurytemora carolleeae]|uniref:prolyl 4-hydroxylase subunit alpha-2 n=1 Tax=Eurytemora carolleeae TaxID=1294199 RepID=UPI000C75F84C|nr:prolyl 4-hydroxylase subunit alpha-2 [Eurytemora carolleeae]|eukprot:XP_023346532.1 prolyl 4-hydroxylase subunit alpha-2-like [Eurytemora affinis]